MANGEGCTCNAYGECECGCGADWTPQEVYDLRDKLTSALEREKVLIHRLKYAEKIMVEMENEMINNWNHASMIFAEYVNKYDPIKEE